MRNGSQKKTEDTVAKKLVIAAMKGNVLVMIGTQKNVNTMFTSMEKGIARGTFLYHIQVIMVAENHVVFVANGDHMANHMVKCIFLPIKRGIY